MTFDAAAIAAIMAENAAIKQKLAEAEAKLSSVNPVSFKVTEKGAVSLYGLGRFPVTLYQSQWDRVFSETENLKKFMEENKDKIAAKPEKATKKA